MDLRSIHVLDDRLLFEALIFAATATELVTEQDQKKEKQRLPCPSFSQTINSTYPPCSTILPLIANAS